jgi:tetratricopeptide (TPR) repeat protein
MVACRSVVVSVVAALPLVAVLDLVLVGDARAGKFTHEASVKPEVQLSERAKPPPRRDDAPKPPSADVLLAVEVVIEDVHLEQAELLRGLIARTPDENVDEKAEYYLRLGELHARTQRLHRLKGAEDEIALGNATDPKRRAALAQSLAAHRSAERTALAATLETYRALIENPRLASFPNLDTAVFGFAYTLQHAGPRWANEALAAFGRLLKDFPRSRYVTDAHLALGDAAFEAGQLGEAAARYEKVLRFPAAPMYRYAQYKLGWVLLAQKNYQDALEMFYQVADGTRQVADRQVLYRAAKHDFVRAYAEVGRADRAVLAFQRVDDKDAYGMLAALGDLYLDQGKYGGAIFVFRALLAAQPNSARVCAWQHAIARATLATGTTGDKVHEIEELVRLYAALRDHPGLPAGEAAECREAAADMSGQLARAYHQEAVKTQSLASIGYADRLYRAYLGAFRDAPDFAQTQYFHAELTWVGAELTTKPGSDVLATQKWEAAARAFTQVVETGKLGPKLVQVSADAAMQAWMKALAVDPTGGSPRSAGKAVGVPTPHDSASLIDPQKPGAVAEASATTDGKPAVPRPLPERFGKLLAAYDVYLKYVPDGADDERVGVLFLKADLLRRFDHLAEAIPLFEQIVAQHPEHEAAEDAAQLALDSDNRLLRWDAMHAFAKGLTPAFLAAHPQVKQTVDRLAHQALRIEAQALEAQAHATGKLELYVRCGERYLEIYNRAAFAPDADELVYNAGVCLELGRSLGGAIRMYETLGKLWPKSKLAARALARLGNVYATTAQYRESAERLEAYAASFAGEGDAYRALSDAVQFRKGLGDDKQAIADTEKFVAMFGARQPAEAAGAFFSLVAIYEKLGDLDRLAHHLRAYLDRHGAAGGADRRVIAWAKLGDVLWRQACPVATVDGACVKVVRVAPAGRRPAAAGGEAIPRRCGDETRSELTVVPRDEGKVRAATAAWGHAIAEYEHARPPAGDARGALYYYAVARFGRAERNYEQYLAMPIPGALDFDERKPAIAARSHRRFDTWFSGKTELGARLRGTYQALTTLGDAAIAIAAATRIAAIAQNLSAQLYRAEIPANLRTGPYAEATAVAYCETLEKVAEPLETSALDYYQACLTTSTRLGWFSEWSRICERELGQLRPERFPSTLELRSAAAAVATITQLEAAAR